MSSLISYLNPVSNLLGYSAYSDWEYCVFERPLTKEKDENEDAYLTRLAYTAEGIDAQIEYLDSSESSPTYTFTEKKVELSRLKSRIKDFESLLGFFPSYIKTPDEFILPSDETDEDNNKQNDELPLSEMVTQNTVKKMNKIHSKNKLYQVLEHLLRENMELSINEIWVYFFDNQQEELFSLIEVKLVTEKTGRESKLYWLDAKTGNEGAPITRKSLASAISKVRKSIKISN